MKCPRCGNTENLLTERRPNGDSICHNCRYAGPTTVFQMTPQEKKTEFREWWIQQGSYSGDYYSKNKPFYSSVLNEPCKNLTHVIEYAALVAEQDKVKQVEQERDALMIQAQTRGEASLAATEKVIQLQSENQQLREKLLAFEGKTFSENQEIAELKEKLEAAENLIRWYGNPENYIARTSTDKNGSWSKKYPRSDEEMILNYTHPNTDSGNGKNWTGTVTVGGKRAREYMKESKG